MIRPHKENTGIFDRIPHEISTDHSQIYMSIYHDTCHQYPPYTIWYMKDSAVSIAHTK